MRCDVTESDFVVTACFLLVLGPDVLYLVPHVQQHHVVLSQVLLRELPRDLLHLEGGVDTQITLRTTLPGHMENHAPSLIHYLLLITYFIRT